jgi:hypothetical protein
MASGGLWRQMGWKGAIAIPIERALLADEEFWTWLPAAAKKNGVNGFLSIVLNAEVVTEDPARAAFAVARSSMDGISVSIRVRNGKDLEGFSQVASCHSLTCPGDWIDTQPVAMKFLRDLAARMGAQIGATGIVETADLAKLGAAGIRRAQGPAVGGVASPSDTYESHLAVQ